MSSLQTQKKTLAKKQKQRKVVQRSVPEKKQLARKLARSKRAKQKHQIRATTLKKQLAKGNAEAMEKVLKRFPPSQQMAFRAAVQALNKNTSKGLRYDKEWLMNCLLLRISSPKAYKLLTKMKILPLPSMNRLRQILKGMPCRFGFNNTALECIGSQMKGKQGYSCYGTLILDEMKVRKAVAFDESKLKMDGFIDYGGNCGGKEPADHALVMMFVPLFDNWVQPIASFASKGAAPGDVLAHLVTEAVMELAKHNASVIAVVSDGAGSNKSMWARLGISGRLKAAVHKVQHPCMPGEHLHFLCDMPHMVKCIRNHLQRHNHAQVS